MKKRVSIIIPVYNAERYLHRCIQSILDQSYENWETIFVNDGSTDSSLNILQEYAEKDHRFRITNKSNGGPSSARNAGLDALQTDFFTFVDADDSINPNFLQKTLEAAIANDCDLVVTGIRFQEEDCPVYLSGLVKLIPSQYVKYVSMGPVAKLYRSKIVNNAETQLRFHEDMSQSEDYVFTTSYASRIDKYYVISEPMYHYYYDSDDSLTHRFFRNEIPLKQYLHFIEAPWRIYQDILNVSAMKRSQSFFNWSYALYNELWHMLYWAKPILSPDDQKKLTAHFWLRHKDFIPHVGFFKRVCALQRHPCLYKMLRSIWRKTKQLIKR